jgi:hypothetical protein
MKKIKNICSNELHRLNKRLNFWRVEYVGGQGLGGVSLEDGFSFSRHSPPLLPSSFFLLPFSFSPPK